MAKQTGLSDRLHVDGYDLSGNVGSISKISGGPSALDVTDITQSAYSRLGGLRNGGIDFSSWFDKAAGMSHARLSPLPRTDVLVTYLRGAALGNAAASMVGLQINYDGNRNADGSFSLAVSAQSDGYGLEWGRQLTPGVRADGSATNGTGVDDGASTSFGAQFYLHVEAFTGTSVTVKIQDSADNATFADLAGASFVAATGVGWQRIAVTGTVRRYLRVATTGTFTNAAILVNGVRNLSTTVF